MWEVCGGRLYCSGVLWRLLYNAGGPVARIRGCAAQLWYASSTILYKSGLKLSFGQCKGLSIHVALQLSRVGEMLRKGVGPVSTDSHVLDP